MAPSFTVLFQDMHYNECNVKNDIYSVYIEISNMSINLGEHEYWLTHYSPVMLYGSFNIGSNKSFFSTKSLPKLMLAYCQLDPWEQISVQFEWSYKDFHSRKCIFFVCNIPDILLKTQFKLLDGFHAWVKKIVIHQLHEYIHYMSKNTQYINQFIQWALINCHGELRNSIYHICYFRLWLFWYNWTKLLCSSKPLTEPMLTHWGWVMHTCVGNLGDLWFR